MKFLDCFESFIENFLPLLLLILFVSLIGCYVAFIASANSPATDQQLLAAKTECPTISSYLPNSVATSSSLEFYVQKCHDDQVISKQRAILK